MFCVNCGHKLVEKEADYFDSRTGKPAIRHACPNVHCPSGCMDNGGHFYKGIWNPTCTQCGVH